MISASVVFFCAQWPFIFSIHFFCCSLFLPCSGSPLISPSSYLFLFQIRSFCSPFAPSLFAWPHSFFSQWNSVSCFLFLPLSTFFFPAFSPQRHSSCTIFNSLKSEHLPLHSKTRCNHKQSYTTQLSKLLFSLNLQTKKKWSNIDKIVHCGRCNDLILNNGAEQMQEKFVLISWFCSLWAEALLKVNHPCNRS